MLQRGMCTKDSPGTWETRTSPGVKESGEDRGVGDVPPRLWESCSVLAQRANKTELEVPRNEGNEVNREGCAGVLARNMTNEAGELSPTGPGGGKDESGERNCWRSR